MSSSMDTDSFQSSPDFTNNNNNISPRKYALSGRIMLTAIIILFFIVILMIILHLYARWYLLRVRRRRRHHHLRRRTPHLVFYMDPSMHATTTAAAAAISTTTAHGLDPDVLKRLPVFTCKENSEHVLECAVCLSEFKENEAGRLLPKCGHVFHTECIDMWFHSHSTCPLCRDVVELVEGVEQDDGPSSSRSVEGIKVEDGFRSSLSRVLSFGRILSRDGRRSVSCGGDTAVEEEVVVVVDVEVGREARESRADWGRIESSRRSSG